MKTAYKSTTWFSVVKLVLHFWLAVFTQVTMQMSGRHSQLFTAEVAADFVTRHFCKKKFHTSDLFARAAIANEQTLTTSNSNITSDDT